MKYTYLALIFLIIICGCKPFEKLVEEKKANEDLINFLFQDYIGEKPSASFIVIKDGKIKDCQSFGYSDLENKILANCETNYRLGSVTKQFTAMATLILINKGKLNYDTKLTEVIPEFPNYGKEITVKDLLSHRSGLQSYFKLHPKNSEKQVIDRDVLNLLKEQDSLQFPSNSKYEYSNSGYAILALIVEKVSNKSFKQFMDDEIFKKLGMSKSTVYQKNLSIKNRALGYKFNDTIFEKRDQNAWSAVQGDGGIYSSVKDYYLWDKSLYGETLIATDLKEDAFTIWDSIGKNKGAGYGFGWHIEIKDDKKYLIHGGSTTGFRNYSLRIPSEKISVAIYTNTADYGTFGLKRKALFLASLYSDNQLLIPIDVILEKEISNSGSEDIKDYYNKLTSLNNIYDTNPKDLVSLGFNYKRNKEDKNCLNVFNFVIEKFPNYYGGYYGLAQYYKTKGNSEKAIEYYKIVAKLATRHEQQRIDYSKKMIKQLSE